MKCKKNDFIELEFTAKANNQVFDTTSEEEARKSGIVPEEDFEKPDVKEKFKPLKLCIGQQHVIPALDKALEGKELGKEYEIEIKAKEAYGPRDTKLIRTVPLSSFEQMPERGMFVNVNGVVAKVISVTGGRVTLDMNHPLAGKDLFYKFRIIKIIEDVKEKIKILLGFYGIEPETIEMKETKTLVSLKGKIEKKAEQELQKKVKELVDTEAEFKFIEGKKDKVENKIKQ